LMFQKRKWPSAVADYLLLLNASRRGGVQKNRVENK